MENGTDLATHKIWVTHLDIKRSNQWARIRFRANVRFSVRNVRGSATVRGNVHLYPTHYNDDTTVTDYTGELAEAERLLLRRYVIKELLKRA